MVDAESDKNYADPPPSQHRSLRQRLSLFPRHHSEVVGDADQEEATKQLAHHRQSHIKKHHTDKIVKYLWKDVKARDTQSLDKTLEYEEVQLTDLDPEGLILNYAVNSHLTDVAQILLKHKSPLVCDKDKGLSPLDCAIKLGYTDIITLLLDYDSSSNPLSLYEKRTALHLAVKQGNVQVIRLLVQKGVDVNVKDIYGTGALHIAAGIGLEDVTEILIQNGALVNMIDNTGRTAFHHCAEMNQISTAKLLVRNKANTSAQTNYGKTPLHLACHRGHLAIVELLLAEDVVATIKDVHGKTALDYTSNQLISSLVKNAVSKPAKDSDINTVKHIHMTIRSKSLSDLLDPEYVKEDYYDNQAKRTAMQTSRSYEFQPGMITKENEGFSFKKMVHELLRGRKRSDSNESSRMKWARKKWMKNASVDSTTSSGDTADNYKLVVKRNEKLERADSIEIDNEWDNIHMSEVDTDIIKDIDGVIDKSKEEAEYSSREAEESSRKVVMRSCEDSETIVKSALKKNTINQEEKEKTINKKNFLEKTVSFDTENLVVATAVETHYNSRQHTDCKDEENNNVFSNDDINSNLDTCLQAIDDVTTLVNELIKTDNGMEIQSQLQKLKCYLEEWSTRTKNMKA